MSKENIDVDLEVSSPLMFRNIVETVGVLRDDPVWRFSYEGLEMGVMDPSHVCMLILDLPRSFFDVYHVYDDVAFSVDIPTLLKGLKLKKRDRMMKLQYVKNGGDEKLIVRLISDIMRVKKFPTESDVAEEELPVPKIFYKTSTRLTSNVVKRILDDYKGNLTHVTFTASDEGLRIWGGSSEYEESVLLDRGNEHIAEHHVDEKAEATFDLEWLRGFMAKATKVSNLMTVELMDDMPIKIDVELPIGSLTYYQAPCIGV